MKFQEFQSKLKRYPIFSIEDVFKWFGKSNRQTTINQISYWTKKGYIQPIKRGIYKLSEYEIKDPFIIASFMYAPSYVSLESALNYYSIIPDVPFAVTSVTIKKTKEFNTRYFGKFLYAHITSRLFFGFESFQVDQYSYTIAKPEKALFDFLYLRAHTISIAGFPHEHRFYFEKDYQWPVFKQYCSLISPTSKKFHQLKTLLLACYAA